MQEDSIERLREIVRRGSETDFYKFIECLNNTGQLHVSRILTEDGAVALTVANISPANNRGERERRERQLVDQFSVLLIDTPDELLGKL